MAKTGKSRPSRSPLQPLSNNINGRPNTVGSPPIPAQPFQPALRPAQAFRRPELPLPSPRPPRLPSRAPALPPRRAAAATSLRGPVPLGQLVPNAAGEHLRCAEAEAARAGVHGVAAAVSGVVERHDAPRRRQKELQHRFAQTQGEGARNEIGDAQAKR